MGIVGGVMLGLGASMMTPGRDASAAAAAARAEAEAHDRMAETRPAVPEVPEKPDDPSTTGNAAMEAAREREKQQAALRRLRAREIFTSGLGAAGLADTRHASLLGG